MKSFITSVVALASTFVACEARTIGSRSACGTGGELVTITVCLIALIYIMCNED